MTRRLMITVLVLVAMAVTSACAGESTQLSEGPSAGTTVGSSSTVEDQPSGPYFSLLTRKSSDVEQILGKPSSVQNDGTMSFVWQYDSLGLTLYLSTYRPTNQLFVTTLFQRKGRIVGDLLIGDSEEKAMKLTGPVMTSSQGERIVQLVAEDCVFTLTLDQGKVVKARVEPVGREG